MTKLEEFLFTGKCTGSSHESSPCWATPAHLHKAPDPPIGVNLFRAGGVWLCKSKPAGLGLALGPALFVNTQGTDIVLCHMVAAFRWKERDSHPGQRAALWKRQKRRAKHTEVGLGPCRRAVPAHTHTRHPLHKPQALGSITPAPGSAGQGWHSPCALCHPWPVLPAASQVRAQAKF